MGVYLYDVIIIGAGPGGNIAAIRLASMGHKVVLLDWRKVVGDKLCTGIVGKECVEKFPPNETHIHQEAKCATVVSPAGKRYQVTKEQTQAYIIDRVAYVDSFAKRAIGAGATYHLGYKVTNIDVSTSGVIVTASSASKNYFYKAKMVIIASGFASPLLKMVGLHKGLNQEYLLGEQAEVSVNGLENTEVYLGNKISPGSFGWLVPISDSKALVGLISRHKLNGHIKRFLDELRLERKVDEVIKPPKRWGIPLTPLSKTYGNRVIAIGDSAGLAKPTTGGGIYYALRTGEMAAEVIGQALELDNFTETQLKIYQSKWKQVFGRELLIGYSGRVMYETLKDSEIEKILNVISSSGLQQELMDSSDFSFDWHAKIILKALRHRYLGSYIKSFSPILARMIGRIVKSKL